MRNLKGKTMIVTGAAGGIGTAIARLFDTQGVLLVLSDIDSDGLAKTARLLTREPLCVTCDITKLEQVRTLVMAALERFGTVDILVNNAGIIEPSLFEHCTQLTSSAKWTST
jgi:NADP-dependent 3-hydroxy acid dehydrogenase YdfG